MAIRQTPKRKAAYSTALKINKAHAWLYREWANATLYHFIEQYGYHYHKDKQCWSQQPYVKSQYLDDNNNPSGLISLRIQAHPDDAAIVQGWLMGALVVRAFTIEEVSDPEVNANGVGVRIYIRARLPEPVKARK